MSWLKSLQYLLVVSLLYLITFAFAGRHPFAIYLLRLGTLAGIFLILIEFVIFKSHFLWALAKKLAVPITFYLAFILFVCLQIQTGPAIFQKSIGSIGAYLTREVLAQNIFYALFFILSVSAFRDRKTLESFAFALSFLVFSVALLGVCQKLSGTRKIYWIFEHYYGTFFGSFRNENHFGGFLAMSLPLFFGTLHYSVLKIWQGNGVTEDYANQPKLMRLFNSGSVFLFLLLLLTVASCFLADARVASWVIVADFFLYLLFQFRKRRGAFLMVLLFSAGVVALITYLSLQGTLRLFQWENMVATLKERFFVFSQSWQIFEDFPWFGIGFGTYRLISPKYVSLGGDQYEWHETHGDYLQFLIESGAAGFLLAACALLTFLWVIGKNRGHSPSAWSRMMSAQAGVVLINIAVMELVDFHLQIPANALLFAAQLAILCRIRLDPELSFVPEESYETDSAPPKGMRWLAAGVLFAGVILLFDFAQKSKAMERYLRYGKKEAVFLEDATYIGKGHPEVWFRMGLAYYRQYVNQAGTQSERETLRMKAKMALRKSVYFSPTQSHYWFEIGRAEYRMGYPDDAIRAFKKAMEWAPYKSKNLLMLWKTYIMESEKAPDEETRRHYLELAEELRAKFVACDGFKNEVLQREWLPGKYYDLFRSGSGG